jgi:hypothetical protein
VLVSSRYNSGCVSMTRIRLFYHGAATWKRIQGEYLRWLPGNCTRYASHHHAVGQRDFPRECPQAKARGRDSAPIFPHPPRGVDAIAAIVTSKKFTTAELSTFEKCR